MNNTPNTGGRINPAPSNDPLRVVSSEQRRVVDSDINQLKTNSRTMTNSVDTGKLKNISSSREFSRQMNREVLKHKGRVTPLGVKQVAARMHIAGYSSQSIQRGMRHYNQQFSRMSSGEFRTYFNRHIKPALRHPKVAYGRQQNDAFKRQHGIPRTYKNVDGLQKINSRVQKQHQKRAIAYQQSQQRQIAQNRQQAVQHSYSRRR